GTGTGTGTRTSTQTPAPAPAPSRTAANMLTALAAESWAWYAITWLIVLVRIVSRRDLHGSFRKLQVDDGLMLLAMVTDTVLIAAMNIVANTSSNLIDPNDTAPLTSASIAEREYGSKMYDCPFRPLGSRRGTDADRDHMANESMSLNHVQPPHVSSLLPLTPLVAPSNEVCKQDEFKAEHCRKNRRCICFFGLRLDGDPLFRSLVSPIPPVLGRTPDNVQCSAATNHLITNAILNISSDLLIIMIPMPILLQAQLPIKKKAILCGVFALGTFTVSDQASIPSDSHRGAQSAYTNIREQQILAAVLNKFYSFHQPFGSEWTFWYIRESSTAIIVTNLPSTWTLCRRVFNLRSFHGKSSGARTSEAAKSRFTRSGYGNGRSHISSTERRIITRSESQEQIFHDDGLDVPIPLKIYQQHEVSIKTERVGDSEGGKPLEGHGNVSFASASTPTSAGFSSIDMSRSGEKKNSSESDSVRSTPGVTTVCTRY
ncbi:hypothetical protein PG997_003659, partial [Apiospora hydei]